MVRTKSIDSINLPFGIDRIVVAMRNLGKILHLSRKTIGGQWVCAAPHTGFHSKRCQASHSSTRPTTHTVTNSRADPSMLSPYSRPVPYTSLVRRMRRREIEEGASRCSLTPLQPLPHMELIPQKGGWTCTA